MDLTAEGGVGAKPVTGTVKATVQTAVDPGQKSVHAMHPVIVLIIEDKVPQNPPIGRLMLLSPKHAHSLGTPSGVPDG